jgi:hypothetical protein
MRKSGSGCDKTTECPLGTRACGVDQDAAAVDRRKNELPTHNEGPQSSSQPRSTMTGAFLAHNNPLKVISQSLLKSFPWLSTEQAHW